MIWKTLGRNLYFAFLGMVALFAIWQFMRLKPNLNVNTALAEQRPPANKPAQEIYYYAFSASALQPDSSGMVLLKTASGDSTVLVKMDSVRFLQVADNFENERFPEAVFKFKNLRTLWVGMRGFKTIPPGISQLQYLEEIDFQHGAIEKLPDEFCQLKHLRTAIFLFSNLKELPECIGALEQLETLHLGFTHLTRFPESMKRLKKLKTLLIQQSPDEPHISNSEYLKLKAWLPNCDISHERQFMALKSNQNANTELAESILEQEIYYCATSASALQPDSSGMVLLKTASLDSTVLVKMDSVRFLQVIQDFENERFPEAVFKFKNLRILWVGMGGFKTIPPGISQLQYLEEIDFQHGAIEKLPDEFCQLKHLRTAIFLFSNLKELPECIGALEQLETLHLGFTHLTRFPETMKRLKKLKMVLIQQSPDEPHISNSEYLKLKAWLPKCGIGHELRNVD